ncbi:bifunctional metallophosphatase/5'-nucleotidase [Peribacillus sp. SCS-26]|uniref:bifunctional metallophosphatase/5'-nucleotidase n=1 Tax=Paraperibacillus marinus TaxID=3115295 RepID=UPI003905BB39
MMKKNAKALLMLLATLLYLVTLPPGALSHAEGAAKEKEGTPAKKSKDKLLNVQLLGMTDFHGYLQPMNDAANGKINSPDGPLTVGGAAYMATHLDRLAEGHKNSIRLSVGDNFSGWPFEVAAFRDEPTIELMNKLNVELTAAGNHEFDPSLADLTKHMMKGTCIGEKEVDSCFRDSDGKKYKGSDFTYLSANIRDAKTGKLLLKPYTIKKIPAGKGKFIPVGFLGLTTTETVLGTTSYQEGILTVDPLTEAADRYTKELKAKGVETIVAVVHEGGTHDGYYNSCLNPRGPVIDFAKSATPEIDAIFTGHWHGAFNCSLPDPDGNPRPVVEGSNHGRLLTELNLWIDPKTKEPVRELTTSDNIAVTRDVPKDPEIDKLVNYWADRGRERAAEPVAKQTGDLTRARNKNGESTLANLAADAHYAAGQKVKSPAEFALTASSPLRGDLPYKKGTRPNDQDGQILYGEQWDAQGYQNPVVVVSLTGREIDQILEEQWRPGANGTGFFPLAVSHNVSYTFDNSKPAGQKVSPEDVLINGEELNVDRTYRVAALAYLIRGSDGYQTFKQYRDPERGEVDHWAFLQYLKEQKVIEPSLGRVHQTGE